MTGKRKSPAARAKAAVAEANAAIRAHGKVCNICTQLTRTRGRHCDPGWLLQTDLLAARKQLRAAKADALQQDTLF